MDTQLKKGVLEVCILSAILAGETYGYRIMQDISPYVSISESTLYPILKRLEGMRAVTATEREYNGRKRRYYMITETGRDKIENFKRDLLNMNKVYQYIFNGGRG